MSLHGKIALITGAGTGIGKGVAVELAKRGGKIAIHYNASSAGAEDTKRRIDEIGAESMIVQADVAYGDQIDTMVKSVAGRFGGIDILVNNAALQTNLGLFDYDDETYDRVMAINLKGYWLCMQAVLPFMKEKQSGRIINISSVHAKRPTDFDVVYAMTKGGITMLTRETAIEWAKYGITVNAIEPGAVEIGKKSGNPRPMVPPEMRNRLPRPTKRRFLLGGIPQPSDVGHLVCHIASDESRYLTGAAIRLDGGSMLL